MLSVAVALTTSVILVALLIALYIEFKVFKDRLENFIRMDEIYTIKFQNLLNKHFEEEEKALSMILK